MREIKFRLWDKESEKMHYPRNSWDAWCFDNEYDSIHFPLKVDGFMGYRDLNKAELMQYTGLKDKNGKEIYEGDIVEEVGDQHYLWIVEWNQDECCFEVRDQFSDTCFDTVDLNAIFRHGEVIGNIYENPHLLEGTK